MATLAPSRAPRRRVDRDPAPWRRRPRPAIAVLVVATRGEQGEPQRTCCATARALKRRVVETHKSAEILGADRVEFLGYEDWG